MYFINTILPLRHDANKFLSDFDRNYKFRPYKEQ